MAEGVGWIARIGRCCARALHWFGERCQRIRDVLDPLADLRIMLILLGLGGLLLLVADAGKDVIRQLVDSANATDFIPSRQNAPVFLRWTVFLLSCVWTGVNAWYWAHLLYKSKNVTDEQPTWFTWVRRGLGVLPLIFAIVAMPLSARHGLRDNWIAMLIFALAAGLLMVFFITRNSIADRMARAHWKMTEAADTRASAVHGPNTFVRGDFWFIYSTLVVSAVVLVILCIPVLRTHFSWTMGPAALTFGAIGCIIPVTSVLIYYARSYSIPIVLIGIIAFVIFSFWNDNHAIRALDNAGGVPARKSVREAYGIWKGKHQDLKDPLILIASAGGASRAAYWTATVLRAFDDRTQGKFFDNVFAISSVSGGTLGSIGYAAWLSDRSLDDEKDGGDQRLQFVQKFFGTDYLGPSLGGLLYTDLLQRFLPAPLLADRAVSLEEAFEMGWDAAANCNKPPCAKPGRFAHEYTGLWAKAMLNNPNGRWVPLVLANGTSVETGKRIIAAPVVIDGDVFEDAYDFYALNPAPVRASTAVLNSARFTLVSPPGRLMKDGHAAGGIIDGGYFENGALETLYDLARFVEKEDAGRTIIIVEILNDDTMKEDDLSRHPPDKLPVLISGDTWSSGLLGEFTSIVGGLYETRSSRGILGAKRLSATVRSGLTDKTSFVSFDLRPFGNDCQTAENRIKQVLMPASERDTYCYTAMSWALSLGSRDAMDVSFNATHLDLEKFFQDRDYTAARMKQEKQDLEYVIKAADEPRGNNATLGEILSELRKFDVPVQGAQAPAAAAKRN